MIVYLHGMPGSHQEAQLFGALLPDTVYVPDRTGEELDPTILAHTIISRFPEGPITLIGFSMGAFVAMQLAPLLGDRIEKIHLIAPAAPLTSDALLADMAGAPLFRIARFSPSLFQLITRLQAWLPASTVYRSLFATAKGEERALADDVQFKQRWIAMMRHCLRGGAKGYRSEILAFVRDWSAVPSQVKAPVIVWHGTEDRLTPPALVESLIKMLPNVVHVHRMPDTGHYSTLKAALPAILGAN